MVEDLIDTYGVYLVYLRRDTRYRCSCWQENTEEIDRAHPDGGGTGCKVYVEKRKALRYKAMATTQKEYAIPDTLIGLLPQYGFYFYFKRGAWPRALDRILAVEWNVKQDDVLQMGRVTNLLDVHEIQSADAITYTEGVAVAHECAVHNLEGTHELYEEWLRTADFTWSPRIMEDAMFEVAGDELPILGSEPPSTGSYGS
jgi:hypothetical protein